MNFARISKSLASVGVVGALAAAGVASTSTTADAATTDGNYTCTSPLGSLGTFAMHADALLPPSVTAGFPVVADLLSMTSTLTVPAAVAPAMATVTGGTVDDFAMTIGSMAVHVPLTVTGIAPNPADGSVTITAAGKNQAFNVPAAGTKDVKLPKTFNFTPTSAAGPLGFNVTCTSDSPATLTSILITKQLSTITVGKVKTVRTTQHAKVPVTVKNDYSTPTGKVVAKEGSKTLGTGTLKAGKAVISLARLKPGLHKVVVTYLGDAYTKGIKATAVTVKIIK